MYNKNARQWLQTCSSFDRFVTGKYPDFKKPCDLKWVMLKESVLDMQMDLGNRQQYAGLQLQYLESFLFYARFGSLLSE